MNSWREERHGNGVSCSDAATYGWCMTEIPSLVVRATLFRVFGMEGAPFVSTYLSSIPTSALLKPIYQEEAVN